MKKTLLLSIFFAPLMAGAWNVSTEPTYKSAIIEEFTGTHCPNCPDGHRMASMLYTLHPDEVHPVAIHAGAFARPSKGEPDFCTSLGTYLNNHFEVSFYPSAVVNRKDYQERMVLDRNMWGQACREVLKEISPVNLFTQCSYDPDTRVLTLDVEGYLTSGMSDPRLNVFLLQSEILGPQSGGLLGEEYPHRNMLRAYLTEDQTGDQIEVKTAGEYFSRTFSYTLPEAIGGVATDPVNMEIVAFVTEGEDDVCTVSSCRPDTSNLPQTFSVECVEAPLFITKNHAFDFFEVVLENHGGESLTSADFDVTINKQPSTCRWEGEILPYTNQIVRVPFNGLLKDTYDEEDTSYIIRLTKANGKDVEFPSFRGTIQKVANYPSEFTLKIKTDLDASDNKWRILDKEGEVIYDFGGYPDGEITEVDEHVALEPGKIYCLEVSDSWGDGVCHPLGNVKLNDMGGKQIIQYKEIKGYGLRQFFRTYDSADVKEINSNTLVEETEFFDLEGRKLSSAPAGLHLVEIRYSDGTVRVEKRLNR